MSRDALIAHLLEHAIQQGDFVLKSGRRSTWFCDAKQTVCRPEGMLLIAELALELIPVDATAIGGLTAGADPVAFGIAAVAATRGRHLRSFSIRKEAKDHGVQGTRVSRNAIFSFVFLSFVICLLRPRFQAEFDGFLKGSLRLP